MAHSKNCAALIISLGKRTYNPASRAVFSYGIPQSDASGIMVLGFSLEYSRENQPGGKLIATPLGHQDGIKRKESQINALYDVDQADLKHLDATLNQIWEEFRLHATRARKDPEKIGVSPNQIIVIADTWDPNCSYLLIPVLYCLKSLIKKAKYDTHLNIILDISHFNEEKTILNQEVLTYRLMQELSERIDPNPKKLDDPILKQLGFSMDLDLSRIGFFVVSEKKEDSYFAKNHQELEDIIFSFILGMVNPQVRDNLSQGGSFESLKANRRFFSSFGSVGIHFNPETIIDYCALTLAEKFIQGGFLEEKSIQAILIEKSASQVIGDFGNPIQWFEKLIMEPFFSITGSNATNWFLNCFLPDIQYVPPMIDQISSCAYLSNVEAIFEKTVKTTLFGTSEIQNHNAQVTTLEILREREALLNKIFMNPDLFPNFCTNAESVLKFIHNDLIIRKIAAQNKISTLNQESNFESKLTEAKEAFSETLKRFEPPPPWFNRVPEGRIKVLIRKLLSILQQDKYQKLDQIRAEIEQYATRLVCLPYERALADFNLAIASKSIELIEVKESQLSRGKMLLHQFQQEISAKLESAAGSFQNDPTEFDFLFQPVTKQIAESLYEQYSPKDNLVTSEVIANHKWFFEWVTRSPAEQSFDLYLFMRQFFLCIREWNITQIIDQFYLKQPTGGEFPEYLTNVLNKVLNLLEYHFSPSSPNPLLKSALLTENGEPFWDSFFDNQVDEKPLNWSRHYSTSPYFSSFSQTRNGITFTSIEHHFVKGKAQWDALSDAEKQQYDIIPDKDKNPPRAKAELLHDGIWRITYNWHFKPSGGTKSYPFEASIDVDQTNYKRLVNRERYNGQYQLYAEENCAEIDQLVEHFKTIQRQHKWDSFDQASNVLSFVQSFISYRYDKDTKFVEEYPRYPLETLWDRVGDCEDFAILSGSILSRLGLKVALLLYPNPAHLAFGVETAKTHKVESLIKDPKYDVSYYYGEGTNKAWKLGEIPQNYQGVIPDFYRINESSWGVTPEQ